MTAAIEARSLRKVYDGAAAAAVDGLTVAVPRGQAVGLLGPNGAGKTTLLKMICGASPPSSGEVLVYGCRPDDTAVKRDVAVVHQSGPFDMMLSVRDNLAVAAAFRGLSWRRVRSRADELLGLFELTGTENQLVFTLSGGQRRRLQVVRALLRVPDLLLLDEPSAGLDVEGRRRVWATLNELRARHELTIVLTSHHLDEIERHTERVLVIHHGRLIRDGSPAQLRDERGTPRARLRTGSPDAWPAVVAAADQLGLAAVRDGGDITLTGPDLRQRLPRLLVELADRQIAVDSMELATASLEDAFVALTRSEVTEP